MATHAPIKISIKPIQHRCLTHLKKKIIWRRKRETVLQSMETCQNEKENHLSPKKSLKTFPRSEYSICLSLEIQITKQLYFLFLLRGIQKNIW